MKLFTKLYLFNNNVYLAVLSFRKYFNLPHGDISDELFVVRSRISKIDFQGYNANVFKFPKFSRNCSHIDVDKLFNWL
jgi:hypothetical protein